MEYLLLKQHDDVDGLTHVRFTNCHFTTNKDGDNEVKIDIDRSGSTSGQTVVELAGCRGLTEKLKTMTDNVVIKGASDTKESRLIVRDSELKDEHALIDTTNSTDFTESRLKNWWINNGLETDVR